MGLYDRDYMRGDESGFGFRRVSATPWSATIALLVILAVVFVIQVILHWNQSVWLEYNCALSLDGIRHGRYWQLLTFQFLHGGLFHILFNGIALYSFGRYLEKSLGRSRFLMLYFLSGLCGGLLQLAATYLLKQNPYVPVVGASAGIAGLIAAFVMSYPDARLILFPIPVPIRAWTLLWIILPLSVIGTVFPFGGIAHAAHLGGLLAGGAFMRWLWRAPRTRDPDWLRPSQGVPPKIVKEAQEVDDFVTSEVDPILEKIHKQGIQSLTDRERKILEVAHSRMGKR